MKKIVSTLLCFLITILATAEIQPYWSTGTISFGGTSLETKTNPSSIGTLDIMEFYFIESETNFSLMFSPWKMNMDYNMETTENNYQTSPWSFDSVYLCNVNFEWNKFFSDYFLLTPSIGINTLNLVDITKTTLKCSMGISLCCPEPPFCYMDFQMFSKLITLTGGVQFCSTTRFTPDPYIFLGFNLMTWWQATQFF